MTAFIITGKKRCGPRQMAEYLTATGENETVRVVQINSFVAKNVKDALLEMWAIADGTRAKNFLYHATINPRKGVRLTAAAKTCGYQLRDGSLSYEKFGDCQTQAKVMI